MKPRLTVHWRNKRPCLSSSFRFQERRRKGQRRKEPKKNSEATDWEAAESDPSAIPSSCNPPLTIAMNSTHPLPVAPPTFQRIEIKFHLLSGPHIPAHNPSSARQKLEPIQWAILNYHIDAHTKFIHSSGRLFPPFTLEESVWYFFMEVRKKLSSSSMKTERKAKEIQNLYVRLWVDEG